MWRSLEAVSLATPEAFDQNPSLVWQFYHYRREAALRAQPNAAHLALAKMMVPSILARVAPAAQSFHLITQNVDGLSTRAIQAVAEERRSALSSPSPQDLPNPSCLIEMHGRLFDVRCTQCNHTVLDFSSPLCSALHEADKEHTSVIQAGQKEHEVKIPVSELPKCSECGSLARPGVVWFGEEIPLLEDIDKIVAEADLCLVVGTSSRVSPAANFAMEVRANNNRTGRVAEFNIESSSRGPVDFRFIGECETELPEALGLKDVE